MSARAARRHREPARARHTFLTALAATAATACALPATASAHGLAQREDLPIPGWLFAWGAAGVLVISFLALAAAWPRPRLQEPRWRPVTGGRALASAPVRVLGGLLGAALLALTIAAGYVGGGEALDNWAPTFILIWFWVGLVIASILFGDVFAWLSPWRALGRVLPSLRRPYPERLGRWPAALVILAFTWIELASGWGDHPARLASAALAYTVLTLGAQGVWGVDAWQRNGEGFAVYFGLFSRLSVWEVRDGVLGLRPPLGGLPRLAAVPGTVGLVCVMIGSVTFDGLSQGPLWGDVSLRLADGLTSLGIGGVGAGRVVTTVGLLVCVGLVAGFYAIGIDGARSVGGGFSGPTLRESFVHTLVPIAAVYVVAHYVTFLLFEGQAIGYLASDPLGQGWDLFGTAGAGIDYGLISQRATWYVQVAVVVCGHVAGLALAHDRALAIYADARQAVRSQYWMLGVMVGFTCLALWLLSQAGT